MTDKLSAEELAEMRDWFLSDIPPSSGDVERLFNHLASLTAERDRLREALEGLVAAVVRDSAEHGISGYTGARLSDARAALKEQP